jgi:cyclic pyranopterin phosphate synthase
MTAETIIEDHTHSHPSGAVLNFNDPVSFLVDRFGRRIDYLRISLTDRCNFRCVYCMPEEGFPAAPKDSNLTPEEILRIVGVAHDLGFRKLRLTGGEPLLRKDLALLALRMRRLPGISDLSLTTNGYLLEEAAAPLAAAGLNRVNVSLDTLRPDRFASIARRGSIERVLCGIEAAMREGLSPLKINCVAMKGINDDEFADFARWTLNTEVHVRFIELMPMRWNLDEAVDFDRFEPHGGKGLLQLTQAEGGMLAGAELRRRFISVNEIRARIERELGTLEPAVVATNGPARSFRVPGARGTVGFISQVSSDLCANCNRLRLTHDGFLRPCLLSDGELDLRTAMRGGISDSELSDLFRHVVEHKPERHYLDHGQQVVGRGMSQIGG